MKLSGYKRSCGKRSGGISSVTLIGASDVISVQYDRASNSFVSIQTAGGATPAKYHFREGSASYTESVTSDGGTLVRHTLRFLLERLDGATAAAVEELTAASEDGLVAIFTTWNGVTFLAGYSTDFGAERPLRMVSASASTGLAQADVTGETVVLQSYDSSKALPFTGEF